MHFMPLASSFMLLKVLDNLGMVILAGLHLKAEMGKNPRNPDDEGEVLEGEFREM